MKYRDLMALTAAIAFTCGILFALGPPAFIPHFYFYEGKSPLVAWPPPPQWIAYSLGRVLGGALVLIGVIAWKMRNLGQAEDQRNMAHAFFGGGQIMLFMTLTQQIALWEVRGAWFFISLILLIICGFGYLLFWEFRASISIRVIEACTLEAMRTQGFSSGASVVRKQSYLTFSFPTSSFWPCL